MAANKKKSMTDRRTDQISATGSGEIPPLPFRNHSFLFFLATQALGAFNDNVFKQLVLLLAVGYSVSDLEFPAIVQFLFAIPFILFSGLAGDLADRYSKGRLMTYCKIAEILIALAGVGAFALSAYGGTSGSTPVYLWLLAAVAFVLGSQSAFFGPPKYGGLPEIVTPGDLAPATGLTQMTTFLAIIFGVALAGLLADVFADRLYMAGFITVAIAVAGTLTSLGIEKRAPANPEQNISRGSFLSMLPTLTRIMKQDPLLLRIILAYSWFWFVGGVALTAINSYGRLQLGLNNFETSLMVAITSIGIAVGSVGTGMLSRGGIRLGLAVPGAVLLSVCLTGLFFIPVHVPTDAEITLLNELKNVSPGEQTQSRIIPEAAQTVQLMAYGSLFLMGVASGFFSVPLLTFIQARPLPEDKGKVFAAVNWTNWIFILASAIAYGIGISVAGNQASLLLGTLGVLNALAAMVLLPGIFRILRQQESPATT